MDSYELRKRRCKNKDKYELVTAWKRLDLDEVIIRKDEDFMDHLNAAEIKAVDWETWFLPVMASLARTVDKNKLAYWCRTSKKGYKGKYGPMIDASVAMKDNVWVSGAVAMRVLRMKVKRVVDLRGVCASYVNAAVTTMEAREGNCWTPLDSGELFNRLENNLKGDNRAAVHAPRRCFFITGKMGASKTSSTLKYAEMQLRTGKIKSVLYLCPRTVLCAQTAKTVDDLHLEQLKDQYGRKKTNSIILVRRFYTDSILHNQYSNELNDISRVLNEHRPVNCSNFDCCVVNSIDKLPLDRYDMVIADEPVVTVSNFYMDCEAHGGNKETGEYNDYSFAYCQAIRRAKRVFFVDAAFTPNVVDLCTGMHLGGTREATKVSMI